MKHVPDLINHAVRQMFKATHRGDLDAALRWIIIAERQLDIIDRLAGAPHHRRVWRHRNELLAAFEKAAAITASRPAPCVSRLRRDPPPPLRGGGLRPTR